MSRPSSEASTPDASSPDIFRPTAGKATQHCEIAARVRWWGRPGEKLSLPIERACSSILTTVLSFSEHRAPCTPLRAARPCQRGAAINVYADFSESFLRNAAQGLGGHPDTVSSAVKEKEPCGSWIGHIRRSSRKERIDGKFGRID